VNYYERHIGDYIKNTAHLSLLEHGVYARLLDVYYTREKGIPDDQAARLIGARTEPETQALQVVLQEFFRLDNGVWRQDRCDEEIEAFVDREPEREVKRANEDNRLKRHRAERAGLFKLLTDQGQHAPWNIKMDELRRLVAALPQRQPATAVQPAPATAPATPATATHTHSPVPSTHSPEEGKKKSTSSPDGDDPGAPSGTDMFGQQVDQDPKEVRLAEVTRDAVETYNEAPFTKRKGGACPNVVLVEGDMPRKSVRRCIKTAAAICQRVFGSPRITREFWIRYWETVEADDFHAGRAVPGKDHRNWTPDFEFLTRPDVMSDLFDRAMSEAEAGEEHSHG